MINFLKEFIKKYFAFSFLLLLFIASTYYFYQNGFFLVHDYTIGSKIVEMANGLKSFDIPVRWSANLGYGFGMPLFNFYAPLPYFIGAIFYLLGFSLTSTIKILYLLITLISLVSSFKLGKKIADNFGGLVLSAALVLSPYRALNIFVRGALSEAFAMAFFPMVFLALYQLKENKNNYFKNYLLLFISLVAITLSHNLSVLMFIPLAALWSLVILKGKDLWNVVKVFILAFLATSFYTLPSFLEKNLTKINTILTGYFDYHLHFLYIRQFFNKNWGYGGSGWGINDDISFFLGYGQMLFLFIIGILFLFRLIRIIRDKKLKGIAALIKEEKAFFASALAVFFCLFLSIEKSSFLWDEIKILSYIQFPWRWLGSAGFFLAIFIASSKFLFKKNWQKLLFLPLVFTFFLNSWFFQGKEILEDSKKYYYDDSKLISSEMSQTLPDYIPLQMAEEPILATYNQKYPEANVWTIKNSEETKIDAKSLKIKNSTQLWQINLTETTLVNFKIANFTGWKAYLDGKEITIKENKTLGNIQLELPEGQHLIRLVFAESKLRLLSNYLSLVALLTFAFWMFILKNKETN